jgi:Zn-dependent peptidase ImmA (M78 family)/transcriptional regulator with XRE-family HTH domain
MLYISQSFADCQINTKMVRLAREARGLTQKELASRLSIEQGTLSKIENDQHGVTSQFMESLSKELGFPNSFFEQQYDTFSPRTIYYRRLVQIPKKSLYQAEAQMDICRWCMSKLLREVEVAGSSILKWDVEITGSPEECARYVRQYWQIPKGPIAHLTLFAEKNGIIIIHLDMDDSISGFTNVADNGQPIIFLNKKLPADRLRFTLAHEIGHLIMHFIEQPIAKDRDTEKEANTFAAELLAPELEVRHHLAKLDIRRLLELKRFWKASMHMLLYRAKTLNCIPEHQYRALVTKLGHEGYRINEPVVFLHEQPVLAKTIIEMHINQLGYSREEIATMLHILPEDMAVFFNASPTQPKMRIAL